MANALDKGAVWRKWDLHVHAPDTRLENRYEKTETGEVDWDRFCKIIHESDVFAVGITDYFSLNSFFTFKEKYTKIYPNDNGRVFFPNLELRLEQAVHKKGAAVNIHLILPPHIERSDADRLLHQLKLQNRKPSQASRCYTCADTSEWSAEELKGAVTTLDSIHEAIKNSFDGADSLNLENYALIVVSGRDDGLSPGETKLSRRKIETIDRIDSGVHAVFSRGKDAEYWLRTDRIDSEEGSIPHPTFGGCDAHDFESLEKMLGKTGQDESRHWETTWIKADLSWEGLLQTLAEPDTRVRIDELCPDRKDSYRVIKAVEFKDENVFPKRLVFNENLNAIIGSRSSGKSSLLSHIAHAVDDKEVESQQKAAGIEIGPAAGYKWTDIPSDYCKVEWCGGSEEGRVIYVPQNFLNKLSGEPANVTKYILPSVEKNNSLLHGEFERTRSQIAEINGDIEHLVTTWFDAMTLLKSIEKQKSLLGGKNEIENQIRVLDLQIRELREHTNLSEVDAEMYRTVKDRIDSLDQKINSSNAEKAWVEGLTEGITASGRLKLKDGMFIVSPNSRCLDLDFSPSLQKRFEGLMQRLQSEVNEIVVTFLEEVSQQANERIENNTDEVENLNSENNELFRRFENNSSIVKLESDRDNQIKILTTRENEEKKFHKIKVNLCETIKSIETKLEARSRIEDGFVERFNEEVKGYENLNFGVEAGYDADSLDQLRDKFHLSAKNRYIQKENGSILAIEEVHTDVERFLRELEAGVLKIKQAEKPRVVAQAVLTESRDLRFWASLDGDKIGGFEASTMTPGKQSLFALTLILSDAGEEWPLLIDQPEDDLDSRSIYFEIVKFLKKQKTRRQILMVTHNANLVVGADAECVIVANRHGDDRKNIDNRTFDYYSGALENSSSTQDAEFELERQGIREHVVELLDGGSEAFKKRRDKYKL
ncbi:DNA repair protein [Corynebacterium canis]|uniref:DNA repair protein n=1 Tax=Corynebacterium canis TaxID=679663 RepID=A0A5C5UTD4_9CORY|nr:ATP-binding protein [Corynebacterium canis]TWT29109.1 DNA repair protein [Corynebacterium canis]WJY75344.1 hypothetical protein CCANI_07545 [Corynebacterium canis]